MSYRTVNRNEDVLPKPMAPPDRAGRRAEDDYEQMFALSRAHTARPAAMRALDESYVFARLLQGRVRPELAAAIRVRCPDAFIAAEACDAPVASPQRRGLMESFITSWHARHNLPTVDFTRTSPEVHSREN